MPRKLVPDMWLFATVVALVSVGVVMVYSASAIVAADRFRDPYFFLKKQLFWAVLGFGCLWAAMTLNYRSLQRIMLPLLILSLVLLVLVLIPPFSQEINGTRRWLRWGPVSFQPSELAKFSLVVYRATFLTRRREVVERFWLGLLPPFLVAGSMAGLVLVQPDLGSSLTLVLLVFCLLFLAGARLKQMALLALSGLPFVALAIYKAPYRTKRIMTFLDPWADPRGGGFQIIQSYLALGAGGLTGRGLGAPDPFGAFLALGLTTLLACQMLVNLGVVTGALPTKGLPLPFISFGGSSLLMAMVSAGVLLNISQHARDA